MSNNLWTYFNRITFFFLRGIAESSRSVVFQGVGVGWAGDLIPEFMLNPLSALLTGPVRVDNYMAECHSGKGPWRTLQRLQTGDSWAEFV